MLKHLFDNIYIITTGKNGKFPFSCCFYIDDEVKTIIDTPIDTRFVDLFQELPVDLIINTHFHLDHCGCNYLFPQTKIMAHPEDIPAMQSLAVFEDYYGLSKYNAPDMLLSWLKWHPSNISDTIQDGDIIDLGKIKLEVIHTPGHTAGHCALYWREKGVLFSGDIDLTSFGPWYGNEVSDVDQLINSIEKLIALDPKVILSGHKGIIDTNVKTQLIKYLHKVYANEKAVLNALEIPLTLDQLVYRKIIYGRWHQPESMFYFFEKVSLIVHLRRLLRIGLVEEIGDKYRVTKQKHCIQS